MRDSIREVHRYLNGIGIKPKMEHGGKHPKITFEHNGRTWRFPVALTPSDVNSGRAAIQQIRRSLGEVK